MITALSVNEWQIFGYGRDACRLYRTGTPSRRTCSRARAGGGARAGSGRRRPARPRRRRLARNAVRESVPSGIASASAMRRTGFGSLRRRASSVDSAHAARPRARCGRPQRSASRAESSMVQGGSSFASSGIAPVGFAQFFFFAQPSASRAPCTKWIDRGSIAARRPDIGRPASIPRRRTLQWRARIGASRRRFACGYRDWHDQTA